MYRRLNGNLEVFLVHPGGPYFVNRDEGVWSIPKGEIEDGEEGDLLAVARREMEEETGCAVNGDFTFLGTITQKGGKIVHAWAVENDYDADTAVSNTFRMEWPPDSGRIQHFPEVDRAAWFTLLTARNKIKGRQFPLIERLVHILDGKEGDG